MDKWYGGLINDPVTFILEEERVIIARNSGVDYGYGDAQTSPLNYPVEKLTSNIPLLK